MKAISLTQPWATLVAIKAKTIETRSWTVSYRGPLAIHAAKRFPKYEQELFYTNPFFSVLVNAGFSSPVDLPTGVVIATCNLVDCIPTDNIRVCLTRDIDRHRQIDPRWFWTSYQEADFGDYSSGRFAWVLKNIEALSKPIPAKGALRLWEIDL